MRKITIIEDTIKILPQDPGIGENTRQIICSCSDGSTYKGEFKYGECNGQGEILYADGLKFTGVFKSGRPSSVGTIQWPNGNIYVGDHLRYIPMGLGRMQYANGTTISGLWFDGEYMGSKLKFFSDKSVYVGERGLWKREGRGTAIWRNPSDIAGPWGHSVSYISEPWGYSGDWRDNYISGYGKLITNSFVYEGTINQNDPNDFCKYAKIIYEDASVYVGSCHILWFFGFAQRVKPHGSGKMIIANGEEKDGLWIMGNYVGTISETDADGSIFSGELEGSKKNGFGISLRPNVSCYIGEWKNGKRQGLGEMGWTSGKEYTGTLPTDNAIYSYYDDRSSVYLNTCKRLDLLRKTLQDNFRNLPAETERLLNPYSHLTYVGEWSDDRPNGQGYLFSYRWILEGTFCNGDFMDPKNPTTK